MAKGRKRTGNRQPEAIAMLIEDHQKVQKLFRSFERTEDQQQQEQLATQICNELTVHTQLEEQVFYPAAREALEEGDLVDEAAIEHQVAKELIEKIRQSRPHDEEYCALVTVLGEYVNHHIDEEQKELFPQLKKSKSEIDFDALGEEMQQKKRELMSELGLAEGEELSMEHALPRQQRQPARSRAANR